MDSKDSLSNTAATGSESGSQAAVKLGELLGSLKMKLDALHAKDAELHQLWLETQWLQSNLQSEALCLPRNWELIIFRLVRGNALSTYPDVWECAHALATALKTVVPNCE